ncbi:MAG: hypothetical protein ACLUIQ_06985 [Dialister invisus]
MPCILRLVLYGDRFIIVDTAAVLILGRQSWRAIRVGLGVSTMGTGVLLMLDGKSGYGKEI